MPHCVPSAPAPSHLWAHAGTPTLQKCLSTLCPEFLRGRHPTDLYICQLGFICSLKTPLWFSHRRIRWQSDGLFRFCCQISRNFCAPKTSPFKITSCFCFQPVPITRVKGNHKSQWKDPKVAGELFPRAIAPLLLLRAQSPCRRRAGRAKPGSAAAVLNVRLRFQHCQTQLGGRL